MAEITGEKMTMASMLNMEEKHELIKAINYYLDNHRPTDEVMGAFLRNTRDRLADSMGYAIR